MAIPRMIWRTLRAKRRYPVRWLTLLDALVLLLVGYYQSSVVDLIFPPFVWAGVYYIGAFGLLVTALFKVPRRVMAVGVGVTSFGVLAHATALVLRGLRIGITPPALVVGPVIWVVYAVHMATRIAYWQVLDEKVS